MDAVRRRHAERKPLGLGGVGDDSQAVPQPLDRGPAREDGALERVGALAPSCRRGLEQASVRQDDLQVGDGVPQAPGEGPIPDDGQSRFAAVGYHPAEGRNQAVEVLAPDQLTQVPDDRLRRSSLNGLETEGKLYDVGDKAGFVEATVAFALKRPDLAAEVKPILRRLLDA